MNSRTISYLFLSSLVLVLLSIYLSHTMGPRRDRQILLEVGKENVTVHLDGKRVVQYDCNSTLGKGIALEFYEFFDHEKMSSWQQWLNVQVSQANNEWQDVSFEEDYSAFVLSKKHFLCFDSGKFLSKERFEAPFKLRATFRWGVDAALGFACKDTYQGNWLYLRPHWNDIHLQIREHGKASLQSKFHPYDELTVPMMMNGIFFYIAYGLLTFAFVAALILFVAKVISPTPTFIETYIAGSSDRHFLIALTLLSLAVHSAIACYAMHGVTPFWDNQSYIFQARIFARGELSAPAPPAQIRPHFDFSQIIVKDGRWFSKYILGYPLLLSLGILCGHPWLVNVFLLTLSMAVLFCFVRSLVGSSAARFASLLALFSPYVCRWAIPTLSHALSILLGLSVYYFLLIERKENESKYAFLAGLCAGAWACTRPFTALVLSILPGLYSVWRTSNSKGWKNGLKCLTLMLLGGLPCLLCLFVVNHGQMGALHKFSFQAFDAREKLGFGDHIGWLHSFGSFGHTPGKAAANVYWSIRTVSQKLVGIPLFGGLAFLWTGLFFRKKRAAGLIMSSAFPIIVAAYTLYWGPQGWRYYVDASLLFVAIGAIGFYSLVKSLAKSYEHYPIMRAAKLLFALSIILMAFFLYRVNARTESRWWRFNSALTHYLEKNDLQQPALVLLQRTGGYVHTFEGLNLTDPWLKDSTIFAIELKDNSALKNHFPNRHIYRWDGKMHYLGFNGQGTDRVR